MNVEEKFVILILLRKILKEVKHKFFIHRPLKSRQDRGIFYTVFNDIVSSNLQIYDADLATHAAGKARASVINSLV
jgi:hypothetical protein